MSVNAKALDKARKANGPSMAELLPVRDLLDNVMVRTDGQYVAGYRLQGSFTYYGSAEERNALKDRLDSLLRTIPEESIRMQVRYEVSDLLDDILERYVQARRTDYGPAEILDKERERIWRERANNGEYLTRKLAIYFIWDPEAYRRSLVSSGTAMQGVFGKRKSLSPRVSACIQRERQEHEELMMHFEALLRGIESSMISAELKPKRMTHADIFHELQDALGPLCPVRTRLRARPEAMREISIREQMTNVSLYDATESYLDIDRVLWGVVTMKEPPERTYPGIIRDLQTLGFPLVISTNIDIPNQAVVMKHYQRREKKMASAQQDLRGGARIDAVAAQTQRELADIQARILASSTKACHASLSIAFRTSFQYTTDAQHEEAERQIMARRQQIMHVISRMDGAAGLPESVAQVRMLLNTLPGLAGKDKRDIDVLSANAADLMPVEMPWEGTPQTPAMLFATPYRQLVPYSPFDPSHENANAIIAATSGAGKSMLVQQMLLTMGRQDIRVSILERGDSYYYTVKYMGGEMIAMSLDSEMTINPFDLEPGQTEPSRDHLAFLRGLVRHMVGKAVRDEEILDSVITSCILSAYQRARMRTEEHRKVPLLSDVKEDLEAYIDPRRNEYVEQEAHVAAVKLSNWVGEGIYASLFDRYTTVDMRQPWLYFNIEKLKDDPRLETAMSLLIAYTTTLRAGGGHRCVTVLDECWAMLESRELRDTVVQLFRTARKRDACVWGISQAVEDFTGTPDKPNPIGGAILSTTALRLIGRQKGNLDVLSGFLHLSPAAIEKIKSLGMTEKGRQSEFLICIGERSETTHSLYIQPTPLEYWLGTTVPRERRYRQWWLATHTDFHLAMRDLAAKFPHGIVSLPELPEERSGEVFQISTRMPVEPDWEHLRLHASPLPGPTIAEERSA
ncbi:hypothetical protein [Pseudacidobacterium ailaaui]|uniref:TraG/VirB4 family ATPase n=1 Tax=Pseudacidobacterium ailaaui TaxID=1382359 RepID=UPI0012DD4F8A|nr:hypothetical protein [Pseudacidobacterium ailaaui]MDI3255159.1 hypothetical protein [Bacillota bacterium]